MRSNQFISGFDCFRMKRQKEWGELCHQYFRLPSEISGNTQYMNIECLPPQSESKKQLVEARPSLQQSTTDDRIQKAVSRAVRSIGRSNDKLRSREDDKRKQASMIPGRGIEINLGEYFFANSPRGMQSSTNDLLKTIAWPRVDMWMIIPN